MCVSDWPQDRSDSCKGKMSLHCGKFHYSRVAKLGHSVCPKGLSDLSYALIQAYKVLDTQEIKVIVLN